MHVVFRPLKEGWYTSMLQFFVHESISELSGDKWYAEVKSGFTRDQIIRALRQEAQTDDVQFSETFPTLDPRGFEV